MRLPNKRVHVGLNVSYFVPNDVSGLCGCVMSPVAIAAGPSFSHCLLYLVSCFLCAIFLFLPFCPPLCIPAPYCVIVPGCIIPSPLHMILLIATRLDILDNGFFLVHITVHPSSQVETPCWQECRDLGLALSFPVLAMGICDG